MVMREDTTKMEDTKNGNSNGDNLAAVPPRPPQRAVARAVSNLGNTWYVPARK
jgi:hypothetical protein